MLIHYVGVGSRACPAVNDFCHSAAACLSLSSSNSEDPSASSVFGKKLEHDWGKGTDDESQAAQAELANK